MSAMRTLRAPGLTLEPQTEAHAPEMFVLLSEPRLHTYLDQAPPISAEALRERYLRLESRTSGDGTEQWLNWAIRLDSGVLAGFVQATLPAHAAGWIAFALGLPHWGQGIARRATQAMIDELRSAYGIEHLLACAERDNHRSIGLLTRLGFVPAAAALHARHELSATEVLMQRDLDECS